MELITSSTFKIKFPHAAMPTVIVIRKRGISVGGIVAGVTVTLAFMTVVTVVGIIVVVWLLKRYGYVYSFPNIRYS